MELDREARNTVWISIGAAVILFGFLLSLPERILEMIPNFLFPIILMSIGDALVKNYQKSEIDKSIDEGTAIACSNWRAAGIAILWCLITLVILLVCILLLDV